MPEYTFNGTFHITTNNPNLEEIARALNETARIFSDTIKWNSEGKYTGYMYLQNDVDIELPIKEMGMEAGIEVVHDEEDQEEV